MADMATGVYISILGRLVLCSVFCAVFGGARSNRSRDDVDVDVGHHRLGRELVAPGMQRPWLVAMGQ